MLRFTRLAEEPLSIMLRVAAVLLLVTSLGAHSASSQNDSESREVAGHTTSPAPPITHPEREIWLNSTEGLPSRQLLGQKQRVRKVPRKPSLRRHPPLGCQQFSWPEGMQSLAIVGNGPLSSRDREQIKASPLPSPCPPSTPPLSCSHLSPRFPQLLRLQLVATHHC